MTLFAISWLADLRVRTAAFIFTFTQWGQWVVICSWDIRGLWPATHQISFLFFTENNWQELYEMHRNACQCSGMLSMHFRHQTNIQFAMVGQCTGQPPKIICLIRVSSLNTRHLIDKNAVCLFTFLNHVFYFFPRISANLFCKCWKMQHFKTRQEKSFWNILISRGDLSRYFLDWGGGGDAFPVPPFGAHEGTNASEE